MKKTHHSAKLEESDIHSIVYQYWLDNNNIVSLAAIYDVCPKTIADIVYIRTWKEVDTSKDKARGFRDKHKKTERQVCSSCKKEKKITEFHMHTNKILNKSCEECRTTEQKCSLCNIEKNLTCFYYQKRWGKHTAMCKLCVKKQKGKPGNKSGKWGDLGLTPRIELEELKKYHPTKHTLQLEEP